MTTKRLLRLVGTFREMGYDDDPAAPSLHDARGKRGPAHKAEVVAYLRRGKAFSFSPGPLRDYFDDAQYVGTHTMRTDGTYLWPDFVAGYVERHDVELPAEFERHMEAVGWRLPEAIDIATLQHPRRPV